MLAHLAVPSPRKLMGTRFSKRWLAFRQGALAQITGRRGREDRTPARTARWEVGKAARGSASRIVAACEPSAFTAPLLVHRPMPARRAQAGTGAPYRMKLRTPMRLELRCDFSCYRGRLRVTPSS